jgi:hypothetical protein
VHRASESLFAGKLNEDGLFYLRVDSTKREAFVNGILKGWGVPSFQGTRQLRKFKPKTPEARTAISAAQRRRLKNAKGPVQV